MILYRTLLICTSGLPPFSFAHTAAPSAHTKNREVKRLYREIYPDAGGKKDPKPPRKTPAGDPLKNPKDISKIRV